MRTTAWLFLVVIAMLGLPWTLRAEPGDPVAAVLASLVEGHDAGDEEAFAAIVKKTEVPVWVLAGELLKQGRRDVALRLASASADVDAARLVAYLGKTKDEPLDPAALAATAAADQAFARRDLAGALTALEGVEPKGLAGLWVLNGRGLAQRFLQRAAEAEQTYEQMAEYALGLGWFNKAAASYEMAQSLARFRGALPRAIYHLEKQLEVERTLGSKGGITACLINLGGRLAALGRHEEALPHLKDGIALAREIGHEEFLANGLASLGGVLALHGDPEEAQALLDEALTRAQALGDPVRIAQIQSHLARLAEGRFEFERALALLEEARAAFRTARHQAGVAAADLRLSGLCHQLGRGEKALETAREALAILQTMPNPMGQGDARLALAKALQMTGDSDAGWEEAQKAGSLYLAARHLPGMVETALVRSKIQLERGAFRDALRFATEARTGAEQSRNRIQLLAADMLQAAALLRLGDLDEALAGYLRVRDGHAARGAGPELALAWANLGTIYLARGEPGKALEATQVARDFYVKAGALAQASEALANIGAAWLQLDNPEEALRALSAAATEAERSGTPDFRVTTILNLAGARSLLGAANLDDLLAEVETARALAASASLKAREIEAAVMAALLLDNAGQSERARDAYRAAGVAARTLGSPALECTCLLGEGESETRLGHPQAALALCDQVVARAEALPVGAFDIGANRIRSLAHLQLQAWEAAADASEEAASLLIDTISGVPRSLGVSGMTHWQEILESGVDGARRLEDPERMFRILERTRAGQLLEALGGREALRGAAVPEALAAPEREARGAVVEARADLVRAGGRLKEARAARARLQAAEDAYAGLIGRIQFQARQRTEVAFPVLPTLAAFQDTLESTDAYVCYAPGKTTLVALVVTKEAARTVDLGDPGGIADALDAVEAGNPNVPLQEALEALQAFLVTPLRLPTGIRRVILAPSGRLVFVPFQALLPERLTLYTPAARALLSLPDDVHSAGEGVLGLGDPVYAAAAAHSPTRGARLSPLPGTRAEVRKIADVALLGKDASEQGLRDALPRHKRWRAVHFACHGLIDEDRPMASALALSADPENDGFLGVAEIYRMEIPADLVVLSACESGRGRLQGAQGVAGFMGAFFFAGADAVITSLWKVDDEATGVLMTKLYELWMPNEGAGLPLAEALRGAQRHVAAQEKWKHLAYWGAWQLWSVRK